MALTPLDPTTEILPAGIHTATIEEIEEVFGQWNHSEQRPKLTVKLREYLGKVRLADCGCEITLNGSYVMPRIVDPDDLDVIVAVPQKVLDQYEADTLPFYQFMVLDPWRCSKLFKMDLKPCAIGSSEYNYWEREFSKVSSKRADAHGLPDGTVKGLVRIVL